MAKNPDPHCDRGAKEHQHEKQHMAAAVSIAAPALLAAGGPGFRPRRHGGRRAPPLLVVSQLDVHELAILLGQSWRRRRLLLLDRGGGTTTTLLLLP